MINACDKLGIGGNFLNLINGIYKTHRNNILNGERLQIGMISVITGLIRRVHAQKRRH